MAAPRCSTSAIDSASNANLVNVNPVQPEAAKDPGMMLVRCGRPSFLSRQCKAQ